MLKNFLKKMHFQFWECHGLLLKKNLSLNNSHDGETCLIVGNGGTLKYHDYKKISNIPAIGCSYLLFDKRVNELNLKYMVFTDPYELMPIKLGLGLDFKFYARLFKNCIRKYKSIIFFASLTNAYAFLRTPKNLYFFNYCQAKSPCHDISGEFSYTEGALFIMIGIAKYLGFKKAILLGCDYLGVPKYEGHFYSNSKPFTGISDFEYCQKIKNISEGIEITFVSIDGVKSPVFNSTSFSELFGGGEHCRSNDEIVCDEDLQAFKAGFKKKQIYL